MIVLLAQLRIKPGKSKEFKELAKVSVQATRKQKGCISYQLLADSYDDNVVFFVDEWESMELLKDHGEADHVKKFMEQIKDLVVSSSVRVYNAQAISM
ncbi:MAG TPA: putative quinol monooxygenase [Negativicutes bacterium]|jgi:quinol monooxygenase YgiN